MAEKSPNLMKGKHFQIQEAQQISRLNSKKTTLKGKHIIIKLMKTKDKNKP